MRRWTAAGVVLAVLGWASACGGAAGPADLSEAQRLRLQARAVARAWQEWASSQTPVCSSTEVSAELRAALSDLFPAEIEYLGPQELEEMNTEGYRCAVVGVSVGAVRQLGTDLVGVDAGAVIGFLNGGGTTYLFRWDGSQWVDTTPQDTGVTVTSWVT